MVSDISLHEGGKGLKIARTATLLVVLYAGMSEWMMEIWGDLGLPEA